MSVVASLLGEAKDASKCGSGLKLQRVAALCVVDSLLQVIAFFDEMYLPRRRRVGKRRL